MDDIEVKVAILEQRIDTLEKILNEKLENSISKLDDLRKLVEYQKKKQDDLERMIYDKFVKYNGYENEFVRWGDFEQYKDKMGEEFGRIYDEISEIKKDIAEMKASETYFRSGQNFVVRHWSEILGIILTIIMIFDILVRHFGW